MFRALSVFSLLVGFGCVESQDHGMRDDAGTDAFVEWDAVVPDAQLDAPEVDAARLDAGPDSEVLDVGPGDGGETTAAHLAIMTSISAGTDGALMPAPRTRFSISVSAANSEATSEVAPPTKTVGPCNYWPPQPTGTWPPGRYTEADTVALALRDVTIRVDGRRAELEESRGMIVARNEEYVPGAEVEVIVRLSTGTIRRTFLVADSPVVSEPVAAPRAFFSNLVADYVVGAPLIVRWPTTYAPTDTQSVLIAGTSASLDARCVLDHGDGELVFPWADVNADFLGSGIDVNSINLFWHASEVDTTEEAGVTVRVSHSRSTQIILFPPPEEAF